MASIQRKLSKADLAELDKQRIVNANSMSCATPVIEKTLLQQAHEIIHGDREQTYGNPQKNLDTIAALWSIHLSRTTEENITLTARDVCGMMILLKQARLMNTPDHRDSLMDIAGYAGLQDLVV